VLASNGPAVDFAERMKGAERVVVATATMVRAAWRENSHGDRLIVSQVALHGLHPIDMPTRVRYAVDSAKRESSVWT
jgi:hypothetical protein